MAVAQTPPVPPRAHHLRVVGAGSAISRRFLPIPILRSLRKLRWIPPSRSTVAMAMVSPAGAAPVEPQQQPVPPSPAASARPAYGLPAQLIVKPGTWTTIRLNELLASNKNKVGDMFTGTLAQSIVVDGIVVANRGQNVVGRIAEAGKDKDGVHRLGLELTGITLADGTQMPVQSKLASTRGGTTPAGAEVGTVVGTTAVGAGIGAVAGWGQGAAIGAGAGAAAGLIGVILTHNHPSVVYPETALTFEIDFAGTGFDRERPAVLPVCRTRGLCAPGAAGASDRAARARTLLRWTLLRSGLLALLRSLSLLLGTELRRRGRARVLRAGLLRPALVIPQTGINQKKAARRTGRPFRFFGRFVPG